MSKNCLFYKTNELCQSLRDIYKHFLLNHSYWLTSKGYYVVGLTIVSMTRSQLPDTHCSSISWEECRWSLTLRWLVDRCGWIGSGWCFRQYRSDICFLISMGSTSCHRWMAQIKLSLRLTFQNARLVIKRFTYLESYESWYFEVWHFSRWNLKSSDFFTYCDDKPYHVYKVQVNFTSRSRNWP